MSAAAAVECTPRASRASRAPIVAPPPPPSKQGRRGKRRGNCQDDDRVRRALQFHDAPHGDNARDEKVRRVFALKDLLTRLAECECTHRQISYAHPYFEKFLDDPECAEVVRRNLHAHPGEVAVLFEKYAFREVIRETYECAMQNIGDIWDRALRKFGESEDVSSIGKLE